MKSIFLCLSFSLWSAVGFNPQIALDANGSAVAVWTGSDTFIYTNTLNMTTNTWNTSSTQIAAVTGYNPTIAVNSNERGVAVWRGISNVIYASTSTDVTANTWTTPIKIPSVIGYITQTMINNNNQAIMTYQGFDYLTYAVTLTTLSTNTWTTPVALSTPYGTFPQVAMNAGGAAIAIWEATSPGQVFINQLTSLNANTWSAQTQISTATSNSTFTAQIAMYANGNAIAIWEDNTTSKTYAATYNGVWSAPVAISSTVGPSVQTGGPFMGIAVNAAGSDGVAIWQNGDDSQIYASRLVNLGLNTWSAQTMISSAAANTDFSPQVQVDSSGNAIAMWQNNADYKIYANTFSGGTWHTPTSLSSAAGFYPQLDMDASGRAVVVWQDINNLLYSSTLMTLGTNTWYAEIPIP